MAGKSDGGLTDALQLDQAARDLVDARARGSENPADGAAEQLGLFSGSSVFGTIKEPGGRVHQQTGPGRPRGPSRVTRDLVKLIESTGRHPILAMAEIVATPIDVIAATLGCKRIEAAEYHRKVMSDLAPYVAQRLPLAVQVQGANAGMLVINNFGPVGEGTIGLNLVPVNGIQIEAEKLNEINDGGSAPHDSAPHDEAK
ncbi:hypothetical protein MCHK_3016 [Mesorhizobium huakuii 7653R]|nr:hypothetical protein MCHK_3016 [Mesorhizobium huakuii 7653R]